MSAFGSSVTAGSKSRTARTRVPDPKKKQQLKQQLEATPAKNPLLNRGARTGAGSIGPTQRDDCAAGGACVWCECVRGSEVPADGRLAASEA